MENGFQLSGFHQTPGGQYWTFQQTFDGTPIYQASITVKVNEDGRIPFFMNHLHEEALSPLTGKNEFFLTDIGINILLLKRMPAFDSEVEAVWLPRR